MNSSTSDSLNLDKLRCELNNSIVKQLRDVYLRRYAQRKDTLFSIAEKLEIRPTAIEDMLEGKRHMTIKDIADLAWAMGVSINVNIFPKVNIVLDAAD